MRKDAGGGGPEIVGQLLLGDVGFGSRILSGWVRRTGAFSSGFAGRSLAAFCVGALWVAEDLARFGVGAEVSLTTSVAGLSSPEAEEGGLAELVVGGPGGEADLGDEGGGDPDGSAASF